MGKRSPRKLVEKKKNYLGWSKNSFNTDNTFSLDPNVIDKLAILFSERGFSFKSLGMKFSKLDNKEKGSKFSPHFGSRPKTN